MPHFSCAFKSAALAVCVGAAAPSAWAQAFDAVRLYGAAPGADGGTLGVAVVAGHAYMGSNERRTVLLPLLDYQWKNGWFVGTSNGVGIDLSSQPGWNYGLRVTADFGRSESRSPVLKGMGDIKAKPEFGAFANLFISPELVLTSSLRYGAGNEANGLQADVGVAYSIALAPQWRVGVGAAATYANASYLQSYFGVTAAQAAASGHAAYAPGAGLRDARANASVSYFLARNMLVTTAVSARALQGDAKDSPLTRERGSVNGLVAFSYGF